MSNVLFFSGLHVLAWWDMSLHHVVYGRRILNWGIKREESIIPGRNELHSMERKVYCHCYVNNNYVNQ